MTAAWDDALTDREKALLDEDAIELELQGELG